MSVALFFLLDILTPCISFNIMLLLFIEILPQNIIIIIVIIITNIDRPSVLKNIDVKIRRISCQIIYFLILSRIT